MLKISIDGKDYEIMAALRPDFVIADAGGAFAYASLDNFGWSWWAGSPTAEDAEALKKLIGANGGFDVSTVTKEPA